MGVELKVPSLGESITEVQIGQWLKKEGDFVRRDEPVVEIESEKATVELPAPVDGVISKILKQSGEEASVGDVVGHMEEQDAPKPDDKTDTSKDASSAKEEDERETEPRQEQPKSQSGDTRVMPAAQRLLDEHGLKAGDVEATGPGGRLLKEDVQRHVKGGGGDSGGAPAVEAESAASKPTGGNREEESVPMSPMRKTIAKHLVSAQREAALLTTFNEIDMSTVMALRSEHKDVFEKKYGVRLGFMSFFIKATVQALKLVPEVNAEIRDNHIVYKNYQDIAVAIGAPKGLVTPVLRNVEAMSFAEIEGKIGDFAARARENKLTMDELRGGTFTISNGGVYGSLLSTPIVNPPQSGVLGMHAIQERPIALDGEVVIRPMMYIALTYDHRIVDGKGAVTCLKCIKECVENPARILMEV